VPEIAALVAAWTGNPYHESTAGLLLLPASTRFKRRWPTSSSRQGADA